MSYTPPPSYQPSTPPPVPQITCPYCNGANPLGTTQCMWCHRSLMAPAESTVATPKSGSPNSPILIGLGAGALAFGVLATLCSILTIIGELTPVAGESSDNHSAGLVVAFGFLAASLIVLLLPGIIMLTLGLRRR